MMCMADRARALTECKYVDGIIMNAPLVVTPNWLRHLKVKCVLRGMVHETGALAANRAIADARYKLVKQRVIIVDSPVNTTLTTLSQRATRKSTRNV